MPVENQVHAVVSKKILPYVVYGILLLLFLYQTLPIIVPVDWLPYWMLELYFLFIGFYAIPVCVMFVPFSPPMVIIKKLAFVLLLECLYFIWIFLAAILTLVVMVEIDGSIG
jgi:hypothetical protein